MAFDFKRGKPIIDKDGAFIDIKGSNFFGAINDNDGCFIVGGKFKNEQHHIDGEFYVLYEWNITANGNTISAIIGIPYSFTNDRILPTYDELFEIAKRGNEFATDVLNYQFRQRNIDIVDRPVKELDITDKRTVISIFDRDNTEF